MFGYGWGDVGGKQPSSRHDQTTTEKNKGSLKKAAVIGGGLLGAGALLNVPIPSESEIQTFLMGTSATAAAMLGLGLVGNRALKKHLEQKAKEQMEYVQVIPHSENQVNQSVVDLVNAFHHSSRPLLDRLKKGREWFQFYFACSEDEKRGDLGRIDIYVGFPRDRSTYIKSKLQEAFRGCGLKPVKWKELPYFSGKGVGGYLRFADWKRKGLPLQSFQGDKVSSILSCLRPGMALAVSFSPTDPKKLQSVIKATKEAIYKDLKIDPKEVSKSQLDSDVKALLDRLDSRARALRNFDVKIGIWQETPLDMADNIYSIVNEINNKVGSDGHFYLKKTRQNPIALVPYSHVPAGILRKIEMLDRIPLVHVQAPMVWTAQELANLTHLPRGMDAQQRAKKDRHHIFNRIEHIIPGQSDIPADEFTEGVRIGELINPAQDYRPVYLLDDVLRKMALIIGRTGSGKTSVALEMCKHLVQERLKKKTGGFTIVDPKKSFAYTMLTYLNKLRLEGELTEDQEDIFHFFDVTSKEYAFSINPMEKPKGRTLTEDEKNEIVENTISVMKAAYPGESILFEKYAGLAIRCLLEDPQMDHTILAIPEFLDKESRLRDRLHGFLKNGNTYQKRLAKNIERNKDGFGKSDIQPVLNRLHRLQENPRTRRIFGQPTTTIKPLEYMEKGKIVIFNTEGLSQDEIRLVMGYIMVKYHEAANQRRNRAQNHYLIVDESHEVQIPIMWEKIVPKDREFGLCLILLTQFLEQFNDKLLATMTEIGGTFMSCIAGAESAKVIQKLTTGRVNASDLQNLRALVAAVDTEDSEGDRVTFMIQAAPPYVYDEQGEPTYYGTDKQRRDDEKNAAFANAYHRVGLKWMKRDCRPASEIDEEINQYLESLWQKPKVQIDQGQKEAAATLEKSKVVEFKKASGESNPFAHLKKEDEEQ